MLMRPHRTAHIAQAAETLSLPFCRGQCAESQTKPHRRKPHRCELARSQRGSIAPRSAVSPPGGCVGVGVCVVVVGGADPRGQSLPAGAR